MNIWTNGGRLNDLSIEAPNTSASSDPCVAQEYLVSCEIRCRPGSVLVQKSGRVDDDMRITSLLELSERIFKDSIGTE